MTDSGDRDYVVRLTELENEIVSVMRTFESIQENLRLGQVKESQAQLVEEIGDTLRRFDAEFVPLKPPPDQERLHMRVCAAVTELGARLRPFHEHAEPAMDRRFSL